MSTQTPETVAAQEPIITGFTLAGDHETADIPGVRVREAEFRQGFTIGGPRASVFGWDYQRAGAILLVVEDITSDAPVEAIILVDRLVEIDLNGTIHRDLVDWYIRTTITGVERGDKWNGRLVLSNGATIDVLNIEGISL